MKSKRDEEGFGKDLGLIHGVVCVGREIGADRNFWNYLAYDRKVFAEVVKIVKDARANWLILSQEEIKAINEWIVKLEAGDCPYPEDETYYTRSSHSEYVNRFDSLHHGNSLSYEKKESFPEIFRKASQSKNVAHVATMIEEAFVISYLLSGFYSAGQDPDGTKKRWMHGPLSILDYFNDIWNDDPRVPIGCFFRTAELKAVPGLVDIYNLCDGHRSDETIKSMINEIVARLRIIKVHVIASLKQELAKATKS